ncbi:hypothetical protein AB0D30_32110 [Streptomyces sp. NPDC048409]|uniref:hypothetical protein n=1 Tax=Streptomyces sp. NPDC048409 TaxID=3154723 RepID=UPI003427ED58
MSDRSGRSGDGTDDGRREGPQPDPEEPSTQRWPTVTPGHTGVPESPWPVSLDKPRQAGPAVPPGWPPAGDGPYGPGRAPDPDPSARPPAPPARSESWPPTLPAAPAGTGPRSPAPPAPWAQSPSPGGRPALPSAPPPGARRDYTPPPWSGAPTSTGYRLAPPPRRRSGRVLAAVLALVLVAGLVGLGVWYLGRDDGDRSEAGAASPSAPTGTGPASRTAGSPTAASASAAPSVAAGYRVAHDPVGYTLDVPKGWTRRQQQGEKAPVVYYDSPSDGRQVQIFALSEATPAESLDLAENDSGFGYAKQPGYRPGARASGAGWAELSYRYDDRDKGTRQVIDHRFQAADGTLYAIRSSGPAALAAGLVRGPLTAALDSFCPAGAGCS